MSSAMGVLKWTPEAFWKSTVYEYTAAMKGHMIASGADLTQPPSREEIDDAFRAHDERVKASMSGN